MDERVVPEGYEPVRVLGSGGFGEVVLARHRALSRMVAVKRIHAVSLADPDSVARFRREARLLASLHCPSIVGVHDLIVTADGAHLVMEFVPGQPLSDIVARGPVPAAEALPVLRDVADALGAAAERGIVHRDIKPHNIFVLPDGHAKLGDFGLARAVSDPDVFRTNDGTALGTPAYYPPELGQGGGEPDQRSDAYSFAVVAYEILTGRRPYEADDAIALITAHWRLDPPDPLEVLPGMPRKAGAALLAGLRKDPARRLLPHELVATLEAVPVDRWPVVERRPLQPVPIHRSAPTVRAPFEPPAAPAAPPDRPWRRRLTVTVAAAALVLVAGVVAWVALSPFGGGRLEVESLELDSDPSPAVGQCPYAEVLLRAALATNGGQGTLTVLWSGPDGGRLAERTLEVDGQEQLETQLRLELKGRKPLTGVATVQVVGTQLTAATQVSYRCPAG